MGDSHPGWNNLTRGIDHLTWRRTEGAGIFKGWEDKRDRLRIPDTSPKTIIIIIIQFNSLQTLYLERHVQKIEVDAIWALK